MVTLHILLVLGLVWGGLTLIHFYLWSDGGVCNSEGYRTGYRTGYQGEWREEENTTFSSDGGEEMEVEEREMEKDFRSWWWEQLSRRARVALVCAGDTRMKERAERETFLYSEEHRLLFCRNAKVGTTTWLAHFLNLTSLDGPDYSQTLAHLHKDLPPLFPVLPTDPSIPLLAQATVSFSMVRHPFVRLVSAYRDKVVKGVDPHYQWVRDLLQTRYNGSGFPAFVTMVLRRSKRLCPAPGVRPCSLDKHWKPFISRCGYCTTHYNIIAKSETFSRDLRHISRLANVTFEEKTKGNSGSGDTEKMAEMYFGQISRSLAVGLESLYRVDLDMFDYSAEHFIALARD